MARPKAEILAEMMERYRDPHVVLEDCKGIVETYKHETSADDPLEMLTVRCGVGAVLLWALGGKLPVHDAQRMLMQLAETAYELGLGERKTRIVLM